MSKSQIDSNYIVFVLTGGYTESLRDDVKLLKPAKIMLKPFNVNLLTDVILEESFEPYAI